MKKTLHIIEDERPIADTLIFSMEEAGYDVIWSKLGKDALQVLDCNDVDLILMDVGLPDTNGFDLCKTIKQAHDVPILFLTAREEEVDKVIGLEIGGDDYVTKPFSIRELQSRIKVLINRYERMTPADKKLCNGKKLDCCYVDEEKKLVMFFDQPLELTRYEYMILNIMINNPNRVYSRSELMEMVWDEPDRSFDRSVDTHIKTIRTKMKKVRDDIKPIKTHHGLGYSFNDSNMH